MREQTGSNAGAGDRNGPRTSVPIEVDVQGRWDALALSGVLSVFHSCLVQHDRERWVVHARTPGYHGETLEDALETIEEWLRGHALDDTACRVGGRPYLPGTRADRHPPA